MIKTIRSDVSWVAGLIIYLWLKLKQHKTAKRILLWIAAIFVIAWIIFGDNAIMVAGLLISLGANLALLMSMMIMQFVAIFFFMSQTKIIVVRPGDPKSVTLASYWGQPALVKTMREWLHLFNDQKKFKEMGGRYISGILLCGGPGCLSGDTVVGINRGGASRNITLKELVYKFNGGTSDGGYGARAWDLSIPTMIRSMDKSDGDAIRLVQLESAVASGVKKTYILHTIGGRTIRGTEDHPIFGPDFRARGKGLGSLRPGDKIYVDGGQSDRGRTIKPRYKMVYGVHGHPFANHKDRGKDEFPLHRLIVEAQLNDLDLEDYIRRLHENDVGGLEFLDPKLIHVHHIDGDSDNNDPSNLVAIEALEHHRMEALAYKWRNVNYLAAIDEVEFVVPSGLEDGEETYDLTVSMNENFIANGIVVHNTGKSFLARALSGSGGLAFVGIEASGFRGMFWGVDVLRVISIFKKARGLAREFGSAILFLDEIDAVGMSRGGVQGGGQTQMMGGMMGMGGSGALTRLLFEMDGLGEQSDFDRCQNIARKKFGLPLLVEGTLLVMGSTNRPDVLDPALMRPGRFDKKIQVDPPDKAGRREVVEGYLATIKHDDTVNVDSLVADTAWSTPAKICAALTKDAVRLAIFGGRDAVSQRDIENAMMEQAMGIPQPISDWEPDQQRQVAIHEASHAVAQYHLRKDEKIAHLTITRRTGSLGFMLPVSLTDVYAMPLEMLVADVMVALAGHIGTEIVLGKPWTGAGSDLMVVRQRVEYLAAYGYLGFIPMGREAGDGHTAEVDNFVRKCVDGTRNLLITHRGQLDILTTELLDKKDLSGDEVMALLGRKEKTK